MKLPREYIVIRERTKRIKRNTTTSLLPLSILAYKAIIHCRLLSNKFSIGIERTKNRLLSMLIIRTANYNPKLDKVKIKLKRSELDIVLQCEISF